MRIAIFCHSILSDWNHGNAHFLRGVATELVRLGHRVRIHEARDAWSVANLERDHGRAPIDEVRRVHPALDVDRYGPEGPDLESALDRTDLVLVHEWTEPALVRAIGRVRARGGRFRLLFHDTHHRSVSAPEEMERFDLSAYDGVLAFGETVREVYERRGWARRAWVWHEAADVNVFRPLPRTRTDGDLVWIGNWGDGERTIELRQFLIGPVKALGLRARLHGVRYPEAALEELASAGIAYEGWLANLRVPLAFARHRVTVHVPRRPYVQALPGVPTIRVFEALACGIPLVSAPWNDCEGLFRPGTDFLVARDGAQMAKHLRAILADEALAASLARHGRERIAARHTCRHRALELEAIAGELGIRRPALATLPIAAPVALGAAGMSG